MQDGNNIDVWTIWTNTYIVSKLKKLSHGKSTEISALSLIQTDVTPAIFCARDESEAGSQVYETAKAADLEKAHALVRALDEMGYSSEVTRYNEFQCSWILTVTKK